MPLRETRELYASYMAAASGSSDPRIKEAFENIHREDFLDPGPWNIAGSSAGRPFSVMTPSDNPIHLYKDCLIVLDPDEGINNGQPSLHARWIGAVSPQPGEQVLHIGTGMGYYTAILATLVNPKGNVIGYEVNETLANKAREKLESFKNVKILNENAVDVDLPDAEIIYVNAGVAVPPVKWINALKPKGRLIFPWRPSQEVGIGILITNTDRGYSVSNLGPNYFIPCVGCNISHNAKLIPDHYAARKSRSLWLTKHKTPDNTATAIYDELWFSSEEV